MQKPERITNIIPLQETWKIVARRDQDWVMHCSLIEFDPENCKASVEVLVERPHLGAVPSCMP